MRPAPATPEEVGDGEDRLVDVHNPVVPQSIRTRVLAMAAGLGAIVLIAACA